MYFNPIDNINDKNSKKIMKEKINIYIKLVEVIKEKFDLKESDSVDVDINSELVNIGVIESSSELGKLEKILGKEIFFELNRAVGTYLLNKDRMIYFIKNLNNTHRIEMQTVEKATKKPTVVDFFCGAGGLSLGFIQEGFSIELANDVEEVCVETYKYNHPELSEERVIQGDIKEILESIDEYKLSNVDIVVGGPPCQGFSPANQQRIIDDPRNELYKYFVKAVEKIAPKFVVMENVKGMLRVAEQVVEDYSKIKVKVDGKYETYNVAYRLLNAHDFSVAQNRERLIYIAIRSDIQSKFDINSEMLFEEIYKLNENNTRFVLEDALKYIRDLNAPRIKNTNDVDDVETGKKIEVNQFNGNENEYLRLINKNRNIPFLFNHKARYCNDINYEIYRRLDQGDDATNSKIADIMPYSHRNHVFKDKYYKLIANKPSRTITAHLRMDCHSHIHPYQIRSITPREAARIQSFPDDYLFLGAYLKTYMQIGNAVPPMMARGIAKILYKYV